MFDRDIKRIMAIINGVEQEFSEKKISKNFQNALNNAYKRRVLQNEHDSTINETLQKTSVGNRDGKVIMPNTYATAVGKLNEQSGELTVFKQRDNSLGNTHTSPKSSQYATLFKRGRKPQQAFENSNRDLGRANYTYSEGMFAITAQNQNKSQKRRP